MNEEEKIREARRIYRKKWKQQKGYKQKEYERNFYLKKYEEYKQRGEI